MKHFFSLQGEAISEETNFIAGNPLDVLFFVTPTDAAKHILKVKPEIRRYKKENIILVETFEFSGAVEISICKIS